jgi:hypothetical protein
VFKLRPIDWSTLVSSLPVFGHACVPEASGFGFSRAPLRSASICLARSRGEARSPAEYLVSIELGPKAEHEIKSSLEREIEADRWTRLDVEIRFATDETGMIADSDEVAGSYRYYLAIDSEMISPPVPI